MEPIRKHFDNELPFSLLLDYKETKSPQRELPTISTTGTNSYTYTAAKAPFSSIRPFMKCARGMLSSFPETRCTGDSPTRRSR